MSRPLEAVPSPQHRGRRKAATARKRARESGHGLADVRGPRGPALIVSYGRGDVSVPGLSSDARLIDCAGSRLAPCSRSTATRANASRDAVRSACSRAVAWRRRLISRRRSVTSPRLWPQSVTLPPGRRCSRRRSGRLAHTTPSIVPSTRPTASPHSQITALMATRSLRGGQSPSLLIRSKVNMTLGISCSVS